MRRGHRVWARLGWATRDGGFHGPVGDQEQAKQGRVGRRVG